MIETTDGLARVDEIAATEGVDILLIGANDLCAELGIDGQFESPLVRDAYRRALDACERHGKKLGIGGLASRPKLIEEFLKLGARYVSSGADLSFLLAGAKDKAATIRGYLGTGR